VHTRQRSRQQQLTTENQLLRTAAYTSVGRNSYSFGTLDARQGRPARTRHLTNRDRRNRLDDNELPAKGP
jgi:hypothetical protein